ncbi:coiled-coil domain containing 32 domain-containing protein [Ditylenchus destructor]|nr:coiled-coil domain containing 32 domain-containing protein [Ditylenchus destructor]
MSQRNEKDIDRAYLKQLEDRLASLKEPNDRAKDLLSDLAQTKEQQIANLITGKDQTFEDDFLADNHIQANWVQRKVAPETVAVNKQELANLVKHDQLNQTFVSLSTASSDESQKAIEEPEQSSKSEKENSEGSQ